jgi:hypothetical protein
VGGEETVGASWTTNCMCCLMFISVVQRLAVQCDAVGGDTHTGRLNASRCMDVVWRHALRTVVSDNLKDMAWSSSSPGIESRLYMNCWDHT